MSAAEFTILAFLLSMTAGLLGSLLGLGGGTFVVPALTLFLGIDIRYAIGASIISVIATSSGAAAGYVRKHMANLRVAMFLSMATTAGAITGAFLATVVRARWLYLTFAALMGYSAIVMFRKRGTDGVAAASSEDALADRLALHGEYFDEAIGAKITYRVARSKLGLALMYSAGVVSGLLGIGSGALKVPAMDIAMRLPIKVSTATSNLMIGITAAASAGVYFVRGNINPLIAAPVAAGVLVGAALGSRLLARLRSSSIRSVFVVVLIYIAVQMAVKGLR